MWGYATPLAQLRIIRAYRHLTWPVPAVGSIPRTVTILPSTEFGFLMASGRLEVAYGIYPQGNSHSGAP